MLITMMMMLITMMMEMITMMITMRTTRRRNNTGRLLTLGAMSGKGAEVRRFCFAAKKLEEVDEDEDRSDDCGDGNWPGREY